MELRPLRGRLAELRRLQNGVTAAAAGQAQLLVVEGPRRVGKTFLLQHLLRQLPTGTTPIYFEATQAGERDHLRRFNEALTAALGADAPPLGAATNWEQVLASCAYAARHGPLVIVVDEATYLMGSTPGFASIVKAVWDQLVIAAACGGYPLHLDAWDFDASTASNLMRLAGTPGALLLEDADRLLTTLPEAHRRVLIAVGSGRSKLGEIRNEVSQRIDRPLESLRRARFVRAATPLGAPLKSRPEYRVDDAYLRFWFRVLSSGVQRIEAGQGAAVLTHTKGEWQTHLGWVFEQAAREHAVRLVAIGELPAGTQVDEWWTVAGQPCQIDVLGLLDRRTVFAGEAKWAARPLGNAVVDDLAARLRHAPNPIAQPTLLLWGRGGVRPEVELGAVRGFAPAQMLAR